MTDESNSDNNYLEYIKYELSNSLYGNNNNKHFYINTIVDFIYYISNMTLYQDQDELKDNGLQFTYTYVSLENTECYINISIFNFNQFMYNTTNIHNITNNINSQQEDIFFLKNNINYQLKDNKFFKDSINSQQEDITTFKSNLNYQDEYNDYFNNKIISQEEDNQFFKDTINSQLEENEFF